MNQTSDNIDEFLNLRDRVGKALRLKERRKHR